MLPVLAAATLLTGIHADLDGDAHVDTVSLRRHARSFTVRVDTGTRVVTKVVRGFSGAKPAAEGLPRIAAFRSINNRRGLEIIVRVWRGAANDFLIVYALDHGQLVAMTGGPHDPSSPPFVWDVGGTVGTGTSNADCIARGRIGVLDEWTYRGIWHYRMTTYDARPTRLVKQQVYELSSEAMLRELPRDWPKLKRLDFGSCRGFRLPGQ